MTSPNLLPKPTADIECLLLVGSPLLARRVHEFAPDTLCEKARTHPQTPRLPTHTNPHNFSTKRGFEFSYKEVCTFNLQDVTLFTWWGLKNAKRKFALFTRSGLKKYQKKVCTFHLQGVWKNDSIFCPPCNWKVWPYANEKCGPMQVKNFLLTLTTNKACLSASWSKTENYSSTLGNKWTMARWKLTLMDRKSMDLVKQRAEPVYLDLRVETATALQCIPGL